MIVLGNEDQGVLISISKLQSSMVTQLNPKSFITPTIHLRKQRPDVLV